LWCEIAALRGAATLKARALKEVWNIAAVIPVEKNLGAGGMNNNNLDNNNINNSSNGNSNGSFSGELVPEENFLGTCSRELLARGVELLKRTRKGKYIIYFIQFCLLSDCYFFMVSRIWRKRIRCSFILVGL